MKTLIPSDLQLVTDPKEYRLFPCKIPTWSELENTVKEHIRKEEAREQNDPFVFDFDGKVKPQRKCKWGNAKLSRFISRYIHFYKQKPSENRTFILEQLRSCAEENNVKLPTAFEMDKRTPKKRLICEKVRVSREEDYLEQYKVYFDGDNVVAYRPNENKGVRTEYVRTDWDELFDAIYPIIHAEYSAKNKTSEEKTVDRQTIEQRLIREFYEVYGYDDNQENEPCPLFISRKLYNMSAAYSARLRRFERKKDQVRWTAWFTQTYDDKLISSETEFRKKLLIFFRNLAFRKGWRIMGRFEHGEENGRLHFHCFLYIPEGAEIGELVKKSHYSEKEKCWQNYYENTEFAERFGTNMYEDITEATQRDVNSMAKYTEKMMRYMEKDDGEKMFYSRHIPSEFLLTLHKSDMLVAFSITCKRKIKRYVVSDFAVKRKNITIERAVPLTFHKEESDPYELGLLDEEV